MTYFTDFVYFEGEIGNMDCEAQGGSNVMTKHECESACGELERDFNPKQLKNNKICYLPQNKKCRQTGRPNAKTSLICKKIGSLL